MNTESSQKPDTPLANLLLGVAMLLVGLGFLVIYQWPTDLQTFIFLGTFGSILTGAGVTCTYTSIREVYSKKHVTDESLSWQAILIAGIIILLGAFLPWQVMALLDISDVPPIRSYSAPGLVATAFFVVAYRKYRVRVCVPGK